MTDVRSELEAAVRRSVVPTWSEVVRAKGILWTLIADGSSHGIRTLQACLLDADGLPRPSERREKLLLALPDDIETTVTPSHPAIAQHRLALAAAEALVDFIALGAVVEVAKCPNPAEANPIIGDQIVVDYQLGGSGAGITCDTSLPNFAPAYRLAPRLAHEGTQWFLDPVLFTADLAELQLDVRTQRCLTEALLAYRQGVFLGCASLLGAASEGAWYASGEQLRGLDLNLPRPLMTTTAPRSCRG